MAQKNDKAVVWYDGKEAKEIDALCKQYMEADAEVKNAEKVRDTIKKEIFDKAEVIKGLHQANRYQFLYVMPKDTVTVELEKLINLHPDVASDERIYIRTVDIESLKRLHPDVASDKELYKVTRKGTNYIKDIKAID